MFRQTEQFTIGIEEEYQIIDPQTRELSAVAEELLPRAQQLIGDTVAYELMLSQIEIATPICTTLTEAEQTLIHLRQGIIRAAHEVGREIGAAGTHPFSDWQTQPIASNERYQHLVDAYRRQIREQVIFGCHIHVGLPDLLLGTPILNHTRLWLAPLLALSANSPFWLGEDTGYASYRSALWWTMPLAGPPPYFPSQHDYNALIDMLISSKSLDNPRSLYWDIRLSTRFPTIEFRIMDVCLTIRETVLLAGLIRALVRQCHELAQRGDLAPPLPVELVRVSNWRAARYGLEADLFNLHTQQTVPARDVIMYLLEFVRPALETEQDWERVSADLAWLLRVGNGAMRQRAIYQRRKNMHDVVDFIVAETCPA
jgi:carboxylate-amine ligase